MSSPVDLSSFPLLRIDQLDRHDVGTLEKSEEALSSQVRSFSDSSDAALNAYAAKLLVGIRKEIASRRVRALLTGSEDPDASKLTSSTLINTPLKRTPTRQASNECTHSKGEGAFLTPDSRGLMQTDGKGPASASLTKQQRPLSSQPGIGDAYIGGIPIASPSSWRSSNKGASSSSRARPTHSAFVTVSSHSNRSFRDRAKSASLVRKARSLEQSEEFKQKQVESLRLSRRKLVLERMELRRGRRRKAEEAKRKRKLRELQKKEDEAKKAEAEIQRIAEEAKSNAETSGKSSREAILEAAAAAASAMEKDLEVVVFSDSGESLSDACVASDEESTGLGQSVNGDGSDENLVPDAIDCSTASSTCEESWGGYDGNDIKSVSQAHESMLARACGRTEKSSTEVTGGSQSGEEPSPSAPIVSDDVDASDHSSEIVEIVDTNHPSSDDDGSSCKSSPVNWNPNNPPLTVTCASPSTRDSNAQSMVQMCPPDTVEDYSSIMQASESESLPSTDRTPSFGIKTEEKPFRSYPFVSIFPQFWGLFTMFSRATELQQSPANSRRLLAHAQSSRQQEECLRVQQNLVSTLLQTMKDYSKMEDEFDDTGTTTSDSDSTLLNACFFRVASNRTDVSQIITDVLEDTGLSWRELPSGLGLGTCWNLLWTWARPKIDVNSLLVCQKVNRFRSTRGLTRKDLLKKNIQRFCSSFSSTDRTCDSYAIMPLTFVLPQEYNAFVAAFLSIQRIAGNTSANFWIMKPIGLSRGRGISVINDIGDVSYSSPIVIQKYLMNPFLFMKYKFDLRLYVLVTSFNPLEAFLYGEGFARFGSMPFSTKAECIHDERIHLTNSSIQQQYWDDIDSSHPARLAGADGGGNKVRLSWIWRRLEAQGVNTKMLRRRVEELCVKTLVCVEDDIPFQPNSFEVFGFDVMFDDELKPWLVEVNSSPALARETELDVQVKETMIRDTIALVSPPAFDRQALDRICKRRSTTKTQQTKQPLSDKDQLEQDLRDIFLGRLPRQYGEVPRNMGNYKRIVPRA